MYLGSRAGKKAYRGSSIVLWQLIERKHGLITEYRMEKELRRIGHIARALSRGHLLVETLRDLVGFEQRSGSRSEHLAKAMKWITVAQDATGDGGISAGYGAYGWEASYPEITGYIIPTFFEYAQFTGNTEYRERAIRMADYLVGVQLNSGAIPCRDQHGKAGSPVVFDTGQAILGMVRAFKEVRKQAYLRAAIMAGDWLIEKQDDDGCWRQHVFNKIPHTYNVRAAWALLILHRETLSERFLKAAVKNVDWALGNQASNGWFSHNAFDRTSPPLTHTIAYATRGLLECGIYLSNQAYIRAAQKTANSLLALQREDGGLAASFDKSWNSMDNWSCLPGNAQTSVVWLRFFQQYGDRKYLAAASKMNSFLMRTQNIGSRNNSVCGAIKASLPIYGGTSRWSYPSYAAKFFVDALLLEEKISDSREQKGR